MTGMQSKSVRALQKRTTMGIPWVRLLTLTVLVLVARNRYATSFSFATTKQTGCLSPSAERGRFIPTEVARMIVGQRKSKPRSLRYPQSSSSSSSRKSRCHVVYAVAQSETTKNKNLHSSFEDLLPTKAYVPSGLSEEEYEQIKQDEAEKRSKMNYGAFGPRFKQSDRPDGDWFLMSRLWTNGFDANEENGAVSATESPGTTSPLGGIGTRRRRVWTWTKVRTPAFILSFMVLEVLFTAAGLFASSNRRHLGILGSVVEGMTAVMRGKVTFSAAAAAAAFSTSSAWKTRQLLMGAQLAFSFVLSGPAKFYVGALGERWSWSKRRVFWFTALPLSLLLLAIVNLAALPISHSILSVPKLFLK